MFISSIISYAYAKAHPEQPNSMAMEIYGTVVLGFTASPTWTLVCNLARMLWRLLTTVVKVRGGMVDQFC
jgi:hypothetical protein